jgi:hypothetical protein
LSDGVSEIFDLAKRLAAWVSSAWNTSCAAICRSEASASAEFGFVVNISNAHYFVNVAKWTLATMTLTIDLIPANVAAPPFCLRYW